MPYPKGLQIFTIWDEIVSYLVSTKDLLSLALTCRDFEDLIIPDHLEYRYVSCDIRDSDVWKLLGTRPGPTRGIRYINLLRGSMGDACLPRALDEVVIRSKCPPFDLAFTNEDVALFKESLSHMPSLKELTLIQPYSTFSEQHFIDAFLNILTSSTAPSLEGLSLKLIPHVFLDDEIIEITSPSPRHGEISIWPLTGLKRVILCDSIQAAIQLILFCPEIEDLYLSELSSVTTAHLLPLANWTKLRRLSLTFRRLLMSKEDFSAIMTSFFHRHPSIESLYLVLRNVLVANLVANLPPSYLPKLRSLTIFSTFNDFSLTSFLPGENISRLVHLDYPIPNADIDALEQMDNLQSFRLAQFSNITPEGFASFLLKAPNLEKICVDSLLAPSSWRNVTVETKLIQTFLQCSNLTHIFYDFSVPGADDTNFNQSLDDLCRSLSPLQVLAYLQVRIDRELKSLKLERDENKHYSGHQFSTSKEIGGESRYWGNVFLHL